MDDENHMRRDARLLGINKSVLGRRAASVMLVTRKKGRLAETVVSSHPATRELRDVAGYAARLVLGEDLRHTSIIRLLPRIDLCGPGRREAAVCYRRGPYNKGGAKRGADRSRHLTCCLIAGGYRSNATINGNTKSSSIKNAIKLK